MDAGESHRPSRGSGRRRIGLGLLIAELLTILWLEWLSRAWSVNFETGVIGLVAIGFIGGLVMRSWWGSILAPATGVGTSSIVAAVSCMGGCRFSPDDTPFVQFMLSVVYLGMPIALGVALGTPLGKSLGRTGS